MKASTFASMISPPRPRLESHCLVSVPICSGHTSNSNPASSISVSNESAVKIDLFLFGNFWLNCWRVFSPNCSIATSIDGNSAVNSTSPTSAWVSLIEAFCTLSPSKEKSNFPEIFSTRLSDPFSLMIPSVIVDFRMSLLRRPPLPRRAEKSFFVLAFSVLYCLLVAVIPSSDI